MPAPSTCEEFLDLVRESGIVDESVLTPFVERAPTVATSRELAAAMHKAGLITKYQMELLLQGKRRGFIIADKYILLNQLGSGGMANVFLCEHKVMRRRVAIKVLPTSFAQNPEYVERFHREARAAAALDHPNIVRAFDVDRDDKLHFLVMEYVEGCNLQDLVDKEGPVEVRKAAYYICQAAIGLQHAHEAKLVHRDIKPGNLLIDRKGTVKVLDMGLAMFFQEQGQSLTQQYDANAVLGTAEYLAPEQAVDSHGVDIRADIYSLGLTFYFLLTAKSPYGDEGTVAQKLLWHQLRTPKSVREERPEVPEELAAIIAKMLAKDRADRYQTPAEVVKALAPFVKGKLPIKQKTDGDPDGASPPKGSVATAVMESAKTDTVIDEGKDGSGSGARQGKGQSDTPSKRGKTAKGEKSSDEDDDEDSKETKRRKPRSGKRSKAAVGFWTTPRLIWIGSGAGVLVLLIIGVIIWAVSGSGRPTQAPIAQAPPAQEEKKEPEKGPPSEQEKKKEPPKKATTSPSKDDKPAPANKDTPAKDKKSEPPKKQEPAKDKAAPPPKKVNVDPKKTEVIAKPESLEDFFPKPGATLFYDVANYSGGGKVVVRQKWEFRENGLIEATLVQIGQIDGGPLLQGGKVKWLPQPLKGKELAQLRTSATYIEWGQVVPQTKAVVWEPILPLSALAKDSWKWRLPNGDVKRYSVVKFDNLQGKRAVVIRSTISVSDGELVSLHTYVKGLGEVAKSQTLEKMGASPQLMAEVKLVE